MQCLKCGAPFEITTHKNKIYCSRSCKNNSPKRKYDQRPRTRRLRDEYNKLKDKPCMDCGNRFPPECMDWDHRDETTKINSVTRLVLRTPATLQAEIAKCDLVCSNCHRIRTQKRKREKKEMAQAQDKPKMHYNPDPNHGGTSMTVEPLDPRQGQPLDLTIPHAMDTVLPDTRPGVQQPNISPAPPASTLRPELIPKVAPGQYPSGSTGITKT